VFNSFVNNPLVYGAKIKLGYCTQYCHSVKVKFRFSDVASTNSSAFYNY